MARDGGAGRRPDAGPGRGDGGGARLLRELAAAQVRLEVEGDLGAVQQELTRLEERLGALGSQAPSAAQRKLLEMQVTLFLKRQRPAEASALLERAGPDPALEALREKVRTATGQADGTPDTLRNIVADCIRRSDWNRILMLGSAASEHLAELALQDANDFPDKELLGVLLGLDERHAVRFLIDHFDAGGVLWKRRILKALQDYNCITNEGTWTSSDPYVLLEPELLVLCERLIGVPETATGTLKSLQIVEERDALTPELVRAIVRRLEGKDADFAAATMALFDGDAVALSAQPILEAVLGVGDERLRRLAAQKLLAYERSEGLLARAADPDPFVRACAANVLLKRSMLLVERGEDATEHRWSPVIGASDLPRLKAWLSDADELVRTQAVRCLGNLAAPLEPAEYERLSRDPSVQVRKSLVWLTRLPEGMRPPLLARLASDASGDVVAEVTRLLSQSAGMHQGVNPEFSALARDPGLYLPAVEVCWASESQPLDESARDRLRQALRASAEGLRALVSWSLAAGDSEALVELVDHSSPNAMLALSDESLARLLASLPATSGNGNIQRLWDAVRQAQPPRSAALRLLFADATAARTTRVTAARLAADGSEGYREALLGFLHQPTWKSEPFGEQEAKELSYVGSRLSKADGGATCLAILRDASIPRELAQALLSNYPLDVSRSAELTREVLARWFKPELPESGAVFRALEHLGSRPDLAQGSMLEEALVHPAYSYQAIRSMAALRNPAYLPKIARGFEAEWAPAGKERTSIQFEAAQALTSFNDPAAAEYLLLGLRSSDDGVREHCKAGLERLEEYEQHARAWKDRNLAAPTKESALAELVAMLEEKDPAIRRQAALGIATLGAVELIPQLIRLTKDADASVSQAAQKALDRLNETRVENAQEGG